MSVLSPRERCGKWVIDLRRQGFGQRYALDAGDREGAIHASYALLERLRRERAAEPQAQLSMLAGAPTMFAAALDAWEARKEYRREASRSYGKAYAAVVRRELGSYPLADLVGVGGTDRLTAYARELEARGLAGRTIRNRLSIAFQVLRNAAARGWIVGLPAPPAVLPAKAPPVYRWISESMFRAWRAELFREVPLGALRATVPGLEEADAAAVALWIGRRRAYASWVFYTGAHTHDADTLTSDLLFLDGAAYIRHNNKSSDVVPDEQFEMPEPLQADLLELRRLQGRDFYPGEFIAGGRWNKVSATMNRAAARLGFPHGVTPRILRRSFAREMFLRGYTEQEVVDRMGHVDRTMIHEIYVRTPRPQGRARTRWTAAPVAPLPGGGLAKVVPLR